MSNFITIPQQGKIHLSLNRMFIISVELCHSAGQEHIWIRLANNQIITVRAEELGGMAELDALFQILTNG
jgi:hypothetical protein